MVRKTWDLVLSGKQVSEVHKIATFEWGFLTRKTKRQGGKPLSLSMMYRIFTNPFYYGVFRYNNELIEGRHPPMITKQEFDEVLQRLKRNSMARSKKQEFAYTGLIRCGECGAMVTAEHKINRYGYHYVYYHWTKRKAWTKRSQKYIQDKELEKQIISFFERLRISDKELEWCNKYLNILKEKELKDNYASAESLKKALASKERELDRLLDSKLRGLLSDEEYLRKKEVLLSERENIRVKLEAIDKKYLNGSNLLKMPFPQ